MVPRGSTPPAPARWLFDEIKVHGLNRILKLGLDVEPLVNPALAPSPLPATSQFARPFTDFLPANTH